VKGGQEYFDLLKELIDNASHSIHLQFYIFLEDETGIPVMEKLKEAAFRGVSVHVHLDGYASQKLSKKCFTDLRAAGVRMKWFEPLVQEQTLLFWQKVAP
jgi:cardiolipin synthase